ncbi:MAG: hypothetical protein KJZ80_18580 [Hyphomicrobiaceae bacterium]|nr:hypothetical protein [Hyphomicrobiaceae bacterium]
MLTAEEQMELGVLKHHGAGIRELARAIGWSRKTVRRHLRGGEAAAVRKPALKRIEKPSDRENRALAVEPSD